MICFLLLLPLEVNKTSISRTPAPVDSISHKTCIVCPSGNTCSYWPVYHFVNICHTLSWVNIITPNIVVPQTLSIIIYGTHEQLVFSFTHFTLPRHSLFIFMLSHFLGQCLRNVVWYLNFDLKVWSTDQWESSIPYLGTCTTEST